MCRAVFIYSKERISNSVLEWIALVGYIKGNVDGFFYAGEDGSVRTLSFNEYLSVIKKAKTRKALMHLRAATNSTINHENIHGWLFKNYYCVHNGIVHTEEFEKHMCDSYNFFKNITEDWDGKDFEKLKKNIEKEFLGGWGVFMMLSKDLNTLILFNINKSVFVFELDDLSYVIASQEDVVKDRSVKVSKTKKIKKKLFVFEVEIEKEEESKQERKFEIIDELKIEEDMFYAIDLTNEKIVYEAELDVIEHYYDYDFEHYKGKRYYWYY